MSPLSDIRFLQYQSQKMIDSITNISRLYMLLSKNIKHLKTTRFNISTNEVITISTSEISEGSCRIAMIQVDISTSKKAIYSLLWQSDNTSRLILNKYTKKFEGLLMLCLRKDDHLMIQLTENTANNALTNNIAIESQNIELSKISNSTENTGSTEETLRKLAISVQNTSSQCSHKSAAGNVSVLLLNNIRFAEGFSACMFKDKYLLISNQTTIRIDGWQTLHNPYFDSSFGFQEGSGMYVAQDSGYYYVNIDLKFSFSCRHRSVIDIYFICASINYS